MAGTNSPSLSAIRSSWESRVSSTASPTSTPTPIPLSPRKYQIEHHNKSETENIPVLDRKTSRRKVIDKYKPFNFDSDDYRKPLGAQQTNSTPTPRYNAEPIFKPFEKTTELYKPTEVRKAESTVPIYLDRPSNAPTLARTGSVRERSNSIESKAASISAQSQNQNFGRRSLDVLRPVAAPSATLKTPTAPALPSGAIRRALGRIISGHTIDLEPSSPAKSGGSTRPAYIPQESIPQSPASNTYETFAAPEQVWVPPPVTIIPVSRANSVLSRKPSINSSMARTPIKADGANMDVQRRMVGAYEYLCHVSQALTWVGHVLGEDVGLTETEAEEGLRDGVVLFRLARIFNFGQPAHVNTSRSKRLFQSEKLQFRHSDNINHYFEFLKTVQLPSLFTFELTDLYEKKNIPKVIYSIHALSFHLFARGMAPRIGQAAELNFTDDQLSATQRQLDSVEGGVPNFGNISKHFGAAEPVEEAVVVETEEEMRERLLTELSGSIQNIQRASLAKLARVKVRTMRSTNNSVDKEVPALQALARGYLQRKSFEPIVAYRRQQEVAARILQTPARALLIRKQVRDVKFDLRDNRQHVYALQAFCRGYLSRSKMVQWQHSLQQTADKRSIVNVQSQCLGFLARKRNTAQVQGIDKSFSDFVPFQANARGALARTKHQNYKEILAKINHSGSLAMIQAAIRQQTSRRRHDTLMNQIFSQRAFIVQIQAMIRGHLTRQALKSLSLRLQQTTSESFDIQSHARASLVRNKHRAFKKAIDATSSQAVVVQAHCRGFVIRERCKGWSSHLVKTQPIALKLQSVMRGFAQRQKIGEKEIHYRNNMDRVIKVQAMIRAKLKRDQYQLMKSGRNVPLSTVRNFVHLLDDSEADFVDELQAVALRKRVFETIRSNQTLEADVHDLDVKIALVVKNALSFEELVKASKRSTPAPNQESHDSADVFASAKPDKQLVRRRELYENMFGLLQTKPEYLSRMFWHMTREDWSEKHKLLLEGVVMTLFGHTQSDREEYILLKLFQQSIQDEIASCSSLQEFQQGTGTFAFMKTLLNYLRSAKAREYLQDVLGPLIEDIRADSTLDLETNPIIIYKHLINQEESRTGLPSLKSKEIHHEQAIADPQAREAYIHHLQKLRAAAELFRAAFSDSVNQMPYGIRFIAREMSLAIKRKFPQQTDAERTKFVGHIVYYRYLNPAVVTPEMYDVIPDVLSPQTRSNVSQISRMLCTMVKGTVFSGTSGIDGDLFLEPLNDYVIKGGSQMAAWCNRVADIEPAEQHFKTNEFVDHSIHSKPSIHISVNEIYSMHALLMQQLDNIAPNANDPLRGVLIELGLAPEPGSTEIQHIRQRAISLPLQTLLTGSADAGAKEKAMWIEAKRHVLAVLRIQPAANLLLALLEQPTAAHEQAWRYFVHSEMQKEQSRSRSGQGHRGKYQNAGVYSLNNIRALPYTAVKAKAIESVMQLQSIGLVKQEDNYQTLVDAIAVDIMGRNRRRVQRQSESESMVSTLNHLARKKEYLDQQAADYHKYIEAAMGTMQRKGKKRMVLPFTKQFFHLRGLKTSGQRAQFGSYKYSAQELHDRGMLLSLDPAITPPSAGGRQFDHLSMSMSSDEIGVFKLDLIHETAHLATEEIRMEDLLQHQFENKTSLSLFEGVAKVNLNVLLFQLNKKFYSS